MKEKQKKEKNESEKVLFVRVFMAASYARKRALKYHIHYMSKDVSYTDILARNAKKTKKRGRKKEGKEENNSKERTPKKRYSQEVVRCPTRDVGLSLSWSRIKLHAVITQRREKRKEKRKKKKI